MLKELKAPVLVGLLTLAGLATLVYMVSVIKTSVVDSNSYVVYAVLDDATGLVPKSNVTMAGIPVGQIDSIERLETKEGVRALVAIRLKKDVVLYSGRKKRDGTLVGAATVTRKQASILGDYFLALSPGIYGEPLKEGDYIPVVIGTTGVEAILKAGESVADLVTKLDKIAKDVRELTSALAQIYGGPEGKKELKTIADNLRKLSQNLNKIAAQAESISSDLRQITQRGVVDDIVTNAEEISADIRAIVADIRNIVATGKIEELVHNLAKTSKRLDRIGKEFVQLVDEGINPRMAQLHRIFGNVELFTKNLRDMSEHVAPQLEELISNANTLSRELLAITNKNRDILRESFNSLKQTLTGTDKLIQRLDRTVENLEAISANLRSGRGTVGRLLTDDTLIREIEQVVSDAKDFVKRYTLMETELQLTSYYYWHQRNAKSLFAIRFRPSEDKYYLLQLVDDPRGVISTTYTITETNNPQLPPILKEKKEQIEHKLKFTFQFARRWGFISGRFGIMENSGGLGLDLNFFNDRLQFQFDLFEFAVRQRPRLRALLEFEMFKHALLVAGADEVLDPDLRDYFLGASIRFTDRDFKALLTAAPSISP